MNSNVWFPYKKRGDGNFDYKLFCFNHAGGDSNIFRDWIDFDESIEVMPIEIPGRRKRMGEKCSVDFAKLVDDIAREVILNAKSDRVFIYGHSLGAILGKKIEMPQSGCLEKWTKEGVMLLNTSLTVRAGKAGSHRNKGWEILTDKVIELLNRREKPMVFILWGNPARAKKKFIDSRKHCIIEGAHPSPLSAHAGFFGGKYFSKTNKFLKDKGQEPIDWIL